MIFRRWGRVVRRHGVLIVFILLVASMFVTTSTFGTYQNLRNVLQQNSIIGIIACGMTFAIIHFESAGHARARLVRRHLPKRG